MSQFSFQSPVGWLTIEEEDGAIVRLDWGKRRSERTPLSDDARRQLDEYFAGRRKTFDLPLNPKGTEFQQRVWEALRRIPYGRVQTYGDIAHKLKSVARPVGGACGRNPIAIVIPCHRVVGGKDLTGYSGGGGLVTKSWLLEMERRNAGPPKQADLFAAFDPETGRAARH
jgi:methylated-DNA-[protein]-cysteine S-methyltransferase